MIYNITNVIFGFVISLGYYLSSIIIIIIGSTALGGLWPP
jgi:hypothetical protein